MGSISLGNPRQPTTSKIVFDDIKEVFLASEWNSFQLSWKKLDYLHLKDFLKYECDLNLKQPLTPPHRNIIGAYGISNHRLAIEIGWWSSDHVSRDNATFALTMQLKTRHTLCWNVPYITPLEISFCHYMRMQYQGALGSLHTQD